MDELNQMIADGCRVTFHKLDEGRFEIQASRPGDKIPPKAWSVRIVAPNAATAMEALWAAYQRDSVEVPR